MSSRFMYAKRHRTRTGRCGRRWPRGLNRVSRLFEQISNRHDFSFVADDVPQSVLWWPHRRDGLLVKFGNECLNTPQRFRNSRKTPAAYRPPKIAWSSPSEFYVILATRLRPARRKLRPRENTEYGRIKNPRNR